MVSGPSTLYRTGLWRAGKQAVRLLPGPITAALCRALAATYFRCNASRRAIVTANLLPVVDGDVGQAQALAQRLFTNFAQKIADLWRYEAGLSIEHLVCDLKGWDHFAAARKRGRGILLLTTHLGNWELGAPLLAQRGVKVCVITLEEPADGLTELRKAARQRWGIETLVIGQNPFAFVDVIRQLDKETTIALLIDRPPRSSAAPVELFGRPFTASVAAAELARASGCVLLPVCVPRTGAIYRAEVLPEVTYDRAALGSREARQELTQRIVRIFEPMIREYASQWYHFVPIWPEESKPR